VVDNMIFDKGSLNGKYNSEACRLAVEGILRRYMDAPENCVLTALSLATWLLGFMKFNLDFE